MFFESRVLNINPSFSNVENLNVLASRNISLDSYFQSLVTELNLGSQDNSVEENVSILRQHLGSEAISYFECLDDLELDLDSDNSYFNNLASLYSRVFGSNSLNFEKGSTFLLNLNTLRTLNRRHNIANFTSVIAFDVSGRQIARFQPGTVFESLREFRVTNIGARKVLMEKVSMRDGSVGFVPMMAMVDLGTDLNQSEMDSLVQIESEFDFSSMLNLQFGDRFAHRVVSSSGLSLHSAIGDGYFESVTDMNLRSIDGDVLGQIDSGQQLHYTGAHEVFLINGIPLEFLEVEIESDGQTLTGFVCSLGVSATKSLDLLPFVDKRFSHRVAQYPSADEVGDLQTTGLDIRLPQKFKNMGMTLGFSRKFNEYFLFSSKHTLKIAGERMRYLRYRKDYLDENYEREFDSFVIKHGDIRGRNGFEFEFESLDDLVNENIFDSMCLRTINDFANEVTGEDKHTLLVSLINNHHLRFLDSENQIINPMDLIESVREFDLELLDRRNMDDILYFNLFYTGDDSSRSDEKMLLKALIV